MVALIQSENHATNEGKTAGRYQFDTHQTRKGLRISCRAADYIAVSASHLCHLPPVVLSLGAEEG